ncbi:Alpha/Beta hydrolase protein [Parasitella parasitica]|nr:Alpha/Beta hydrolase protein [Parasitella parasitica]
MLKTCIRLLLVWVVLHPASCIRTQTPGPDASWPIIYSSNGESDVTANDYDQIGPDLRRKIHEYDLLPASRKVLRYSANTPEFLDGQFHAALCRTSNCRASFDKWDCGELCETYLPDGQVLRAFSTFPMGVTGNIVLSHQKKTIYVLVRGASSVRNKITASSNRLVVDQDVSNIKLVDHPFIEGAKVQEGLLGAVRDIYKIVHTALYDQLSLTPDYKVDVTGHSFGAGVGSLLVAELNHRLDLVNSTNLSGHLMGKARVGTYKYAAYFAQQNLSIRRYVEEGDDIVHYPDIRDGYVHEGDEYWLENAIIQEMLVCPGPYETRDCSNRVRYTKSTQHLIYWNIIQNCDTDFNNII